METAIEQYKEEVNLQIANKETFAVLLATTFKGLEAPVAKRAMLEGLMRGFKFDDFLKKNIYAVPFKDGYSLITSIDYARKVGMRSGVVGTSAPLYEGEGEEARCTITVKRKVQEYIGEYSATVFFKEYSTGRNLWITKPKTMIAKVAETHALRKACPEEMSQMYIEEEVQKEAAPLELPTADIESHKKKLQSSKTLPELKKNWAELPAQAKKELGGTKDEMKAILDTEEKV